MDWVDWVVSHALQPNCDSLLTYCGVGLEYLEQDVLDGNIGNVGCIACKPKLPPGWQGRVAKELLPWSDCWDSEHR